MQPFLSLKRFKQCSLPLRTSGSDAWSFTFKQVQVAGPTGHYRKYVNLVQFFLSFCRTAFIQNGNWVVVRHSTQKTSLHRWLLRRRDTMPFTQHTILPPFPGRLAAPTDHRPTPFHHPFTCTYVLVCYNPKSETDPQSAASDG